MSPLYYAVGASGFILRCKITQKKRYAQVFYTKNAKKVLRPVISMPILPIPSKLR